MFKLTKPCLDCPFVCGSSTNTTLAEGRIEGIVEDLRSGKSFTCHKTLERDEQHCAGALLFLERENRPNQMMRIAERLGGYDRHKLSGYEKLIDGV